MEGPRPLHEHELEDFVSYLSGQLRPSHAWSIAEEYPLAIQSANLNNVRVVKSENGFLSAAVMKPLVIKSPAGLFKAAAIGSVVTTPEHRNQGLSSRVLESCLESAVQHGCDFAILWTNLYDFYRKIGFELAGVEVALSLPAGFSADGADLRFMTSNKVDPEAILRLYSQHTTGSVRTVEDIRKFLGIPNARVHTAWDSANRLQAYAVEGKGADLDGYVHEWGGGVSKLLPLLAYANKTRPLNLIAPAHAQNLVRRLKELGATESRGILGMIKILNPPNFMMKIKKYARAFGQDEVVLEPRDGKYYMGYRENIFHTDATNDLVKLVFGPLQASQLHPFDKATTEVFEKIFPIPMWVWGWDSV